MRVLVFLFFLSSSLVGLYATHLRAANIEIERVDGARSSFEIILTIFSDSRTDEYGTPNGVPLGPTQNVYVNNSEIPITVNRQGTGVSVGNETNRTTYRGSYNAPSSNAVYTFKWVGENRNANIKNVPETIIEFNLYVESNIYLSSLDLPNNSPQMSIDPVDRAYLNSVFTYNSGAYDIDGDSLSYELIPIREGSGGVREASNTPLEGFNIEGQMSPAAPSIGGGGVLVINPISGTLTWDSPVVPGQYNIAIKINEWRNGVLQGYVVRDMQIIVDDNDLTPPKLFVPDDTCVVAGERLIFDVIAWDSIGDPVALQYFGYPKELGASMQTTPIKSDSIKGVFNWLTNCTQPQDQPYYSYFKAISNPNTNFNLTSYSEIAITVVGGPVIGFTGQLEGENIRLNWSEYCDGSGAGYKIYRKLCDTNAVVRITCETGVPEEWGFTELATIEDVSLTTYLDQNVTLGLAYNYIIVAKTSEFDETYSVASEIVAVLSDFDGPYIRYASVTKHDVAQGTMEVSFSFVGDLTAYNPPLKVELLRAVGLGGTSYVSVDTLEGITTVGATFIDSDINTKDSAFTYKVNVFDNTGSLAGTSQSVSSIDLSAVALERDIEASWLYDAPLYTPDSLSIEVLRDNEPFAVIDSVNGDGFQYVDQNLSPDELFCYYIKKPVRYCNTSLEAITEDTVVSNIACDSTFDVTPPCPPLLFLARLNCEKYKGDGSFENELLWKWDSRTCSEEEISYYDIYYKSNSESEFTELIQVPGPDSTYIHQLANTYAGCYKIRGMDTNGNLGEFGQEVCKENCPLISFPNVVTPNEDGKNDVFMPMPNSYFTKEIAISIYNRWGSLVRELVAIPPVIWDVKDADGNFVSDGVYYYNADVRFEMYDTSNDTQSFKGWISVLK